MVDVAHLVVEDGGLDPGDFVIEGLWEDGVDGVYLGHEGGSLGALLVGLAVTTGGEAA